MSGPAQQIQYQDQASAVTVGFRAKIHCWPQLTLFTGMTQHQAAAVVNSCQVVHTALPQSDSHTGISSKTNTHPDTGLRTPAVAICGRPNIKGASTRNAPTTYTCDLFYFLLNHHMNGNLPTLSFTLPLLCWKTHHSQCRSDWQQLQSRNVVCHTPCSVSAMGNLLPSGWHVW